MMRNDPARVLCTRGFGCIGREWWQPCSSCIFDFHWSQVLHISQLLVYYAGILQSGSALASVQTQLSVQQRPHLQIVKRTGCWLFWYAGRRCRTVLYWIGSFWVSPRTFELAKLVAASAILQFLLQCLELLAFTEEQLEFVTSTDCLDRIFRGKQWLAWG